MFCVHRIKDLPPFRYIKFQQGNKFFNQKRFVYTLIFFLSVIFLFSTAFNIYQWIFSNRIYCGVTVGPYSLWGKTEKEADEFLHKELDNFLSQGFAFKAMEEEADIPAYTASVNGSDIAYSLVEYDLGKIIDSSFAFGRDGGVLKNVSSILRALIFGKKFFPEFTFRDDLALSLLKEKFSRLETAPQNASLKIDFRGTETVVRSVPERNGKVLDYETALKRLKENLSLFRNQEIIIAPSAITPEIKLSEVSVFASPVIKIFSAQDGDSKIFKMAFEDKDWDLAKETLADWIILKKEAGVLKLGLDQNKIEEYLQKKIAPAIEIESKSAKFVFSADSAPGGKVIEFQASTTGKKINYELTVKSFEKFFFSAEKAVKGTIAVDFIEPQVITGAANTFGIEELVGAGETNFVGSPPNRIYNIKNGAKIISGLLIQPGETFSLNTALGEVNQDAGFKPELVIRGDKTTPEFGGGLCQIATTLFRAAINSGLPILERTNHSYRVSYYEPPVGMDATVYSPSPDLKFLNDTEAPILIQSKIAGTKLTFEFWGAKDGRRVTLGVPVIFNITEPEPTKIVETTDLKPGEKKCTEKPHKGADAYFDYSVIYSNGEETTKRFKSHYRAWQEVCLVGVVATSTLSGL